MRRHHGSQRTLARALGLVGLTGHLSILDRPRSPRSTALSSYTLSARPPSHQGGVSCEAPRRYRTPHGVLCVRMFVTFGGGKEVIAALAAELQRRVSPCNGLQ